MLPVHSLLIGFGIACASASVIPSSTLETSDAPAPGGVPISKGWLSVPMERQFNGLQYSVNLTVGTTYQPVTLTLDTTSADMWVNPDCANVDDTQEGSTVDQVSVEVAQAQCRALPRYIADKSASAKNLTKQFSFPDEHNTGNVSGWYVNDEMRISERTIKNQTFGVAKRSTGFVNGVLGLAPWKLGFPHVTVTQSLVDQKIVKNPVWSLALRGADKKSSLIFGGIDTGKYKGQLQGFHLSHDVPIVFLPLTAVGYTLPDSTSGTFSHTTWAPSDDLRKAPTILVALDSTAAIITVPTVLFYGIGYTYPGAKLDGQTRRWVVPCNAPNGTIDFTFSTAATKYKDKTTIHIPYADFIHRTTVRDEPEGQAYAGEREVCTLGMQIGKEGKMVLGNSFLRGTYVVMDHTWGQVYIGEADDCGEKIVPVTYNPAIDAVDGCKGK